jgi:hypothetical protein
MPGTEFYQKIYDRIVDRNLANYNFFNCVLKSKLPLDKFYEKTASLWAIRQGDGII